MKIYVAGHNGLVGSAIVKKIVQDGVHEWIGKTRSQLDLLDRVKVEEFLLQEKPDVIILAAAKVGGIKANNEFPVEFLFENVTIQNNVINAAHKAKIENLIFLGSSCIYPKLCKQPIKEEYLLSGPLEPTNEPYALAKISGLKLIQAYRKEYQKKWISIMPTNIYGPNDNFDLNTSHVLPAMIHKFHQAKIQGLANVELWGTGTPMREFLFSEDLAAAILFLLENFDSDIPINVGSGVDISIKNLATLIASIVGYEGNIIWNSDMPNGAPRKLLDITRIKNLGWLPKVELDAGIKTTYDWFKANY